MPETSANITQDKLQDQTLLEIENFFILSQYRRWKHIIKEEFTSQLKDFKEISSESALPVILKHYGQDEQVRQSISAKQTFKPELKMWEINHKIKISSFFPETDFFKKLKKVGRVLNAIRYRDN